ncbi:RING-H2 finger protein ATL1-like [Aegilops tauschii subsp. strangulata]|uniref:RING-type E3 ubiquitin transferase n=1 Tax=Aegilops tauschii subsp. strangulata TaxID=200361 RepID=A0A453Q3K6_AEGTS|nr:RING-H2 finger protein ATL1-like [Aegilops tauschii subsp. strangulata]
MDVEEGASNAPVFPVPRQQAPATTLLFPPPTTPPLAPYYYYSSSSSPATPSRLTHHVTLSLTSLPILVLTVLGILTTSALLLTYYVFVIRCCLTWHASSPNSGGPRRLIISLSRRRRSRSSAAYDHELPVVHGPAPDEGRGGLGEPAIRALPEFRYSKAAKNGADASECAVCLGEFQEGERVRLLPGCLHVFHAECIGTWLQGCANCPLCRAAITATIGKQAPLIDQPLRPEEVVIQVQVDLAGTGEEGTLTQQQEGGTAASKNSTRFDGDGSSSSTEAHCR